MAIINQRKKNETDYRTHCLVWGTLDTIAANHELSQSRMAILAGLDPTTFNPSKRQQATGLHMPGMASIMAVMTALHVTWQEWTDIWNRLEKKMENETTCR